MKKHILIALSIGLFTFPSFPAQTQEVIWESAFQFDVPYVPTPYEVIEKMFEYAEIQPGDILYDLGCGDGRIVIEAAKRFGVKGVGIDIDPERIAECQVNAEAAGVEDLVTFLNQDLFESNFREATVVTLYLLSSVNYRLRPQLLEQLLPGTRLVSHDFSMREWRGDRDLEFEIEDRSHKIYFWIVPANVTGEWELTLPPEISGSRLNLALTQKFQDIMEDITGNNRGFSFRDLRLEGDRISFRLEKKRLLKSRAWMFEGRVRGNSIKGTAKLISPGAEKDLTWTAIRNPASIKPLDPRPTKEDK